MRAGAAARPVVLDRRLAGRAVLALAVRLVVQQARQELAVQPWADRLRAGQAQAAQAAQAAVARVRRVPAAGRVLVGRMLVDQG
ncbi:hypothetical protein [Kribbella karoonensis]|uniref:Uncharacterized protein n=1 Tax=Kribbella karoonensis TaxID=324851 RepID=A0ABP4PFZ1_9ACTN